MKFSLNQGKAILFSLLALCASCGDADLFDTDKWSDQIEGWEPGVKAKIAQGTFTLWDLVNQGEDDVIVKEGNDLVIQYIERDIYKFDAKEVFDMPEQNIVLPYRYSIPDWGENFQVPESGFSIPSFKIPASVKNIPEGCEIAKLVASANFELPDLEFEYTLKAEFPNIKTAEGEILVINEKIGREGKKIPLHNIELSLSEEKKVELSITELQIEKGQTLNSPVLDLKFGLNDLTFIKAEGKIAVAPLEIAAGNFDMGVDFLEEIGGQFKFTRPEVNIILHNKGIGVPLRLEPYFIGRNDSEEVTLQVNSDSELFMSGNVSNDDFKLDTLGLNATNSNIVEFLAMPPQGNIQYGGKVFVNPKDATDNVIYSNAEVSLDAYVRIPFALSAENLSYKDTLTDIDVDAKYAEKIQEGVIEIMTDKNELGLKLQVKALVLLDEAGNELTTITAVEGKEWLEEGKSIEFKINHEQAVKLGKTDRILLEVVASTGVEDGKPKEVVIQADAQLNFSLMLSVKAKIENLDDF